MVRDYGEFLGKTEAPVASPLAALGWRPFFANQVDADELLAHPPVRVTEVHRSSIHVVGDGIDQSLPWVAATTVGDWLMLNRELPTASRVLTRATEIKRRAAGPGRDVQMIAANLDTAFIVSSCNADFNVARLERFLAVVLEAGVTPVVVLTKKDQAPDWQDYVAQTQAMTDAAVIAVNAKGDEVRSVLVPWCRPGQTVGFLGMSGVGKSTLTNAIGNLSVATGDIRTDDARGRHTTTRRQLFFVPDGPAILDTPGMRELQLTEAASGVGEVFSDLEEIAGQCKFRDCAHGGEPGCKVQAGIASGTIEPERLARWQKLVAEDRVNSESVAQRRKREKGFSRMVNKSIRGKAR